jgi:SAM-dependent methyltransferase
MSRQAPSAPSVCPACGGEAAKSLGTPRVIGATMLKAAPSAVCRCPSCDLLFFVPVVPPQLLLDHYGALAEERWTGDRRADWRLARQAILARMSEGRVLDVGCWTGGFLAGLPPGLERHGIEPSSWAQQQARANGVRVEGGSLVDARRQNDAYAVVSMIDVIEHTTSPLETLALAADQVEAGGILIVATGNSRALPWRVMPLDYWYYYEEHVCFFSERWFRWAAAQVGMSVGEVHHFSHYEAGGRGAAMAELARAVAVRHLGKPGSLPLRLARRARLLNGSTETFHWRDHLLVVLDKSSPRPSAVEGHRNRTSPQTPLPR